MAIQEHGPLFSGRLKREKQHQKLPVPAGSCTGLVEQIVNHTVGGAADVKRAQERESCNAGCKADLTTARYARHSRATTDRIPDGMPLWNGSTPEWAAQPAAAAAELLP